MKRHQERGFMLVIVMVLFSIAIIAEMLTTRYLVNLHRHVQHRQEIVQKRVSGEADTGTKEGE